MHVQDCLIGIFRTLGIDPSISLLQQREIDQMLCLGEPPHRWSRPHHFSARASYEDPSAVPICCGPWHNGSKHFLTFYICPDYWTNLDPLDPTEGTYQSHEANLHKALTESYGSRGLPPTPFPPTEGYT